MPSRKQQFVNEEIYHIVLRGIDDNLIFKDINDYYRGIFSIYEFNTAESITIRERRIIRAKLKQAPRISRGRASGDSGESSDDKRDRLVDILAFCFMPNHIHLLVKQNKDNGITKFMRKVGTGYAGYFNRKYNRKGYVFQNRFLAVPVKNDEQLKTVFVYVHANPVSLIEPKWKEIGIKNPDEAIGFLENYKWSSYPDYLSKKNFPSVTEREFLLQIIGGEQDCRDFVENWIRYKGEIKKFPQLNLE